MRIVTRGSKAAWAGIASLLLLFSTAAPASAGTFDFAKADDARHDFYISSTLSSSQASAVRAAMANLDAQTDMYDVEKSQLWAGTDIDARALSVYEGPNTNFYAWVNCTTWNSAGRCDRFKLTFNKRLPHSNLQSLACHEIGHTVGAGHVGSENRYFSYGYQSCMRSGPDIRHYSIPLVEAINKLY